MSNEKFIKWAKSYFRGFICVHSVIKNIDLFEMLEYCLVWVGGTNDETNITNGV